MTLVLLEASCPAVLVWLFRPKYMPLLPDWLVTCAAFDVIGKLPPVFRTGDELGKRGSAPDARAAVVYEEGPVRLVKELSGTSASNWLQFTWNPPAISHPEDELSYNLYWKPVNKTFPNRCRHL